MIRRLWHRLRRLWAQLQGEDNPDAWFDQGHWERQRREGTGKDRGDTDHG